MRNTVKFTLCTMVVQNTKKKKTKHHPCGMSVVLNVGWIRTYDVESSGGV